MVKAAPAKQPPRLQKTVKGGAASSVGTGATVVKASPKLSPQQRRGAARLASVASSAKRPVQPADGQCSLVTCAEDIDETVADNNAVPLLCTAHHACWDLAYSYMSTVDLVKQYNGKDGEAFQTSVDNTTCAIVDGVSTATVLGKVDEVADQSHACWHDYGAYTRTAPFWKLLDNQWAKQCLYRPARP